MKKVNEIAAAKSGRIRRSPEQWQSIVAAQAASGQNVSAYCRTSGLCAVTLARWRKSFDGLIAATKSVIGQDPLSGHLFVFVNRQANYAKVLYWSRGGYCLWAKRLEQGRFAKASVTGIAVPMTDTELMMWLDGIEMRSTVQRKRFALPKLEGLLR